MATRFLLKRAIAVGLAALLIFAACLCYLRCAEGAPDLQLWLRFGYSGVERHRINVTISQPALALKGVRHRLVVMSHNQNSAARGEMRTLPFVGHVACSSRPSF